jgi:cytochrome d ubiquinol oxidase subunit I
MDNFIAARSQMAMSLAFHIIFATIGVSLPLMMTISEWRWRSTGDPAYLLLAKRWAKGTTILFAVGAVSGTVLSFELGLLWPRFMQYAGSVIGMPFSLEGFAFFTEAIFLGIYLYGWNRVPGWLHLASGIVVAVSGVLSAIFVTLVNGWMNTPTGFDIVPETPLGFFKASRFHQHISEAFQVETSFGSGDALELYADYAINDLTQDALGLFISGGID